MTNKEIIEIIRDHSFSNGELLDLITAIKPKLKKQEKLLNALAGTIYKAGAGVDSLEEYLEIIKREQIINHSVNECYVNYCEWCTLNYMSVKNINEFSSTLQQELNLIVKVIK